jgi:hypothetical protein
MKKVLGWRMYCPNPDCPNARSAGEPAEYREGVTRCVDCGATLVEARPEPLELAFERFVPVHEIGNAALLPIVESLLQSSGIRFFVKGIGGGLDFVSGPVKVYVEPHRAEEARELVAEVRDSHVGEVRPPVDEL